MEKGELTGWCTRCGGEERNFIRHVCRKPSKDAAAMIAVQQENQRLRARLHAIEAQAIRSTEPDFVAVPARLVFEQITSGSKE